jgi:hypothetical protein
MIVSRSSAIQVGVIGIIGHGALRLKRRASTARALPCRRRAYDRRLHAMPLSWRRVTLRGKQKPDCVASLAIAGDAARLRSAVCDTSGWHAR